ncbi:MAG: hypothetical protein QXT64_06975 [Desulfurococcaceae archaeon]
MSWKFWVEVFDFSDEKPKWKQQRGKAIRSGCRYVLREDDLELAKSIAERHRLELRARSDSVQFGPFKTLRGALKFAEQFKTYNVAKCLE